MATWDDDHPIGLDETTATYPIFFVNPVFVAQRWKSNAPTIGVTDNVFPRSSVMNAYPFQHFSNILLGTHVVLTRDPRMDVYEACKL